MLAYKGFEKGLICRGYQFKFGINITEKANCAQNGFHCAENPLDCLNYYRNIYDSVYCVVNAGGDIDEDSRDSKISCTELTIIKQLTPKHLFLLGLAFMSDYPLRPYGGCVKRDKAEADYGYAVVRGKNPCAVGKKGDILCFAKEKIGSRKIEQIALGIIDGKQLSPDVWYDVNLKEVKEV